MPSVSPFPVTVKVLVAGCSYAGLSVAVNLLDLHRGLSPRMNLEPFIAHEDWPLISFEITIVDERDGFCMYLRCFYGVLLYQSDNRRKLLANDLLQSTSSAPLLPWQIKTIEKGPGSSSKI